MKYLFGFLLLTACAIDAREPMTPEPAASPSPPPIAVAAPEFTPAPHDLQTIDLRELVSPLVPLVRADRLKEVAARLREANDVGQDGRLPIFEARSFEMARLLWDVTQPRTRQKPAIPRGGEWRDHRGQLALHVWAAEGRAQPVRYAVERFCREGDPRDWFWENPLNARDFDGLTPLNLAARGKSVETFDSLVACRSVDLTIGDKEGRTPLHELIARGDRALLIALIGRRAFEMHALLDLRDTQARTPWTMALASPDLSLVTLLAKFR